MVGDLTFFTLFGIVFKHQYINIIVILILVILTLSHFIMTFP